MSFFHAINEKVSLFNLIPYPIETHIYCFRFSLGYSVVHNTHFTLVIYLNWSDRLFDIYGYHLFQIKDNIWLLYQKREKR